MFGKTFEVEGLRKSGEIFPVELSLATQVGESGRIFSGILRDITERKRAEEEREKTLAEMERMNRLMMGREKRVIEMKKNVNALLVELGRDPEYQSVLKDGDNEVVSAGNSL